MGFLLRLLFIIVGAYAIYKNRYKVLNYILGISSIRKFVVAFGMDLPFVRDRFLQTVFRG
ncbi:hypothetical protein [Sutcliffiella rhizosphaerae]|uniref:Uncharacterized protein n=1 Tax=Sutcliffiella rhizosphaerae TaxID=2880967 RepID=A0ABN8A2C5_9BACI|nr:hypothetical protein [Sutcliffiella rhizosphaerae]CAG9619303.1 hypothetical protein BACCIP111883_00070 [Sutcliffiella rhizosphaerae]